METQSIKTQVAEITRDLVDKIGFAAQVRVIEDGFAGSALPVIAIESEGDLSMLIGKSGQNLNALDHIVRLIMLRKNDPADVVGYNFVLDINDYRKSRANYILEVAKNAAQRVLLTQKAEALLPMSAYERKLVHTELATYKELQTESIGDEPRRRIVIKPLALF